MSHRWTLALLAVAGAAVIVALQWPQARVNPGLAARRGPAPATADPRAQAEAARTPIEAPAAEAPKQFEDLFAGFATALRSGDAGIARGAAAALRALLRTDDEGRRRALLELTDGVCDADVRAGLALVLGTLDHPDIDPALLAALAKFSDDPALTPHLLHALGAAREEVGDDVFDLGDRPWGVSGPGGLGITVKRKIEDLALLVEVRAFLFSRADASIRLAAATMLRHSMTESVARESFVAALGSETQDGVASIVGESLAGWARDAPETERRQIVPALLDRAGSPEFAAYRFRMENDIARLELSAGEQQQLLGYVDASQSVELRTWAMILLAGANAGPDEPRRRALQSIVEFDADAALRDLAARLLRQLPFAESTLAALCARTSLDPAWNVRFSALESAAAFGRRPEVLACLRSALRDTDPRVSKRATELLRMLE